MVSRSGDRIAGRVVLTSEGDKQVKQMVYRFIRRTMKKGQEANARFDQIGESIVDRSFAIRKGETKAFDFAIPYSLEGQAQDPSGRLGTAEFHEVQSGPDADPRVTYSVSAVAQLDGALVSPGLTVEVAIVD